MMISALFSFLSLSLLLSEGKSLFLSLCCSLSLSFSAFLSHFLIFTPYLITCVLCSFYNQKRSISFHFLFPFRFSLSFFHFVFSFVFSLASPSSMYQNINHHTIKPRTSHHYAIVGNKLSVIPSNGNQQPYDHHAYEASSVVDSGFKGVGKGATHDYRGSPPQFRVPFEQMFLMNDQGSYSKSKKKKKKCHSSPGDPKIVTTLVGEVQAKVGSKTALSSFPCSEVRQSTGLQHTFFPSSDPSQTMQSSQVLPMNLTLDQFVNRSVVKNQKVLDNEFEPRDSESLTGDSSTDSSVSKKFPFKMWDLINDPSSECVHWNNAGDKIVIQVPEFVDKFLPSETFTTRYYPSFIRQLNIYGFKKFRGTEGAESLTIRKVDVFHHEYFKRGQDVLVKLIKRCVKTGKPGSGDTNLLGRKRVGSKVRSGSQKDWFRKKPRRQNHQKSEIYANESNRNLDDFSKQMSEERNISSDGDPGSQCEEEFDAENQYLQIPIRGNAHSSSPVKRFAKVRVLSLADQQRMKWKRKWDQVLIDFEEELREGMSKLDETLKYIDSLI